jgi:hypothetical protein
VTQDHAPPRLDERPTVAISTLKLPRLLRRGSPKKGTIGTCYCGIFVLGSLTYFLMVRDIGRAERTALVRRAVKS